MFQSWNLGNSFKRPYQQHAREGQTENEPSIDAHSGLRPMCASHSALVEAPRIVKMKELQRNWAASSFFRLTKPAVHLPGLMDLE